MKSPLIERSRRSWSCIGPSLGAPGTIKLFDRPLRFCELRYTCPLGNSCCLKTCPLSLLDSARGARARDVSPSRELCRVSNNRKVRALPPRRSTTERIERGGSAQPFPVSISAGSSRYCSTLHRKNRDSQSDMRTTVRSPQAPPRTPFSSVLDVKNPVGALLMRGKLRA